MASRGGRGGGRGGRGYTPPTGAALYLKRSAQECGLDDRNLRSLQDITTPALFPDILWHSNGTLWNKDDQVGDDKDVVPPTKKSSSTLYLIRKGRELHSRMAHSQYQVLRGGECKQEQDVVRYQKHETRPKKSLGAAYIPQELLAQRPSPKLKSLGVLAVGKKKNAANTLTIAELEELEKKRLKMSKEEDADNNVERDEESEDEDVADYTMNYYESEGDDSDGGGGDGEPTF
jgi:hypothetical protein